MDFELSQLTVFPEDTDLSVWPESSFNSHRFPLTGDPADNLLDSTETAADEQTVTDGGVTFTDLEGEPHYAVGEVSEGVWRYVRILPGQDVAEGHGASKADLAAQAAEIDDLDSRVTALEEAP